MDITPLAPGIRAQGGTWSAEFRRVEAHKYDDGQGGAQGFAEKGNKQDVVRIQREHQVQEADHDNRQFDKDHRLTVVLFFVEERA